MNPRTHVLALLCGTLAAGCSSAEGPVAGELEVRLATPNTDDRAVLFLLRGAQTAVTAPSGSNYRILKAPLGTDTLRVLVIAPQGGHLAAGALVRIAVPDTRQAASYVARPLDVATTAYAQRLVTGYQLTVVQP
jgi:hypothetical protein